MIRILLALIISAIVLPAAAKDQLITPGELQAWKDSGREHLLIDVRYEHFFEFAHIPGAINIPEPLLKHRSLPDIDVVLYDNELSGRHAREGAEALAAKMDAGRIFLLDGGMRAWDGQGLPVVRDSGEYIPTWEQLITPEDLREAVRIGVPMQIIDLRDSKSFNTSRIPGAVNLAVVKSPGAETLKSDTLEHQLSFSEEKLAKALPANPKVSRDGAIEQLLVSEILTKAKSIPSSGPTIVVDGNGGLTKRIAPFMKSAAGGEDILFLERGMAGWEATGPLAKERGKMTILHGSDRTESLKEN